MPVAVISVAQMREWEQATWASGQSEDAVIRLAGRAVARAAERLTHRGDAILVLAGRGHNGDDALRASEALSERDVRVVRVNDPAAALAEVASELKRAPALVVDGLFGIGLNRPLAPDWLALIELVNASGLRVLAIDVPSGLNAQTGEAMPDAIRAHVTFTLGAVKEGLLKPVAWPHVGRLEVAPDIGLVPSLFTDAPIQWTDADRDFADYPPPRPIAGHKGAFGHAVIVAGSRGFHGAAVLAARGAQRAQPGLVTLCARDEVYLPAAAQLQAVMVHPLSSEIVLPEKSSALLVGPGLAAPDLPDSLRSWLRKMWQQSRLPLVVDASALDWLPCGPVASPAPRIVTPHPGEAARMLGIAAEAVQQDRFAAVRALSEQFGGSLVVLKGHQTIVGSHDAILCVNGSGNPHLAQGGSGDLLAGFITGLLAQPALAAEPLRALRFAVWQHGAAADELQAARAGWVIEDLAVRLGSVVPGRPREQA
jgi:NAD(P)H-hydrate epimerase